MEMPPNRLLHRCPILEDIIVPEPKHRKPLTFQAGCAGRVVGRLLGLGMLSAVQFEDQLLVETDEIDDIPTNRNLPPEFGL
jgi:hypothetical protein